MKSSGFCVNLEYLSRVVQVGAERLVVFVLGEQSLGQVESQHSILLDVVDFEEHAQAVRRLCDGFLDEQRPQIRPTVWREPQIDECRRVASRSLNIRNDRHDGVDLYRVAAAIAGVADCPSEQTEVDRVLAFASVVFIDEERVDHVAFRGQMLQHLP